MPVKESIDSLSALEVAEQMTYLDHQIFTSIASECTCILLNSIYTELKATYTENSVNCIETKQTIERMQNIVTSEHRFKNLRDALHRSDPPCMPYLGIYLTDLSFIEEGTPNFTEDGLLNFSKMRMVAHVIREIRHFQQTPYKIELIQKVANYLLDTSLLLDEEDLYRMPLEIEPRSSRLSSTASIGLPSNLSTNVKKHS